MSVLKRNSIKWEAKTKHFVEIYFRTVLLLVCLWSSWQVESETAISQFFQHFKIYVYLEFSRYLIRIIICADSCIYCQLD